MFAKIIRNLGNNFLQTIIECDRVQLRPDVADYQTLADPLERRINILRSMIKIQTRPGNYDYSPYMYGMAQGMILAEATLDDQSPVYMECPREWKCDYPNRCDNPDKAEDMLLKAKAVANSVEVDKLAKQIAEISTQVEPEPPAEPKSNRNLYVLECFRDTEQVAVWTIDKQTQVWLMNSLGKTVERLM